MAKSVLDAGFGMLVNFLGYKLKRDGGTLVEVDRFFPSTKLCNHCKFKNDSLTLKDREWTCPECGTHHDRDGNATRNLREEGIRILSTNTVGHTEFQAGGEDVSLVSGSTKKRFSKKQESPVIALARAGECQIYLRAEVCAILFMDSKELAQYVEATNSISKPWLLVQLRLQKLQERRATLSPEVYAQELADIHQDLLNLGEWWLGIEDEAFGPVGDR